jgi:serine/threonine-protein kinase HipA
LVLAASVRWSSSPPTSPRYPQTLGEHPDEEAMKAILAVGSSAGGARPKAFIAYNDATGQVRSGQLLLGEGFRHWLLKFDGVSRAGDHGLADPQGWGAIEYAYAGMARAAGIEMTECRLLEENGRRHFMTRRFDRPDAGGKLHMQTVGALEHASYNEPGTYSYEQVLLLIRRLGLGTPEVEQQFRRMVFNVVARNQDDHVKNIAFLMDRAGAWSLAPAYDVVWAWQPGNLWLASHQMSINGKRDGFTVADLRAVADVGGLKRGRAESILAEVVAVVAGWSEIAEPLGIDESMVQRIADSHRLRLPSG